MYETGHRVFVWAVLVGLLGASASLWAQGSAAEPLETRVDFDRLDTISSMKHRTSATDRDAAAVEEQYGPFRFRCPDQGPQTARPNPPDTRVYYGCPLIVEDEADFFGNLDLAIDPSDPNKIAFFSLHGEPASDGPTSRSRAGMTHTAFTSPNAGTSWFDQPYSPVRGQFGEEAAGTMDSAGHLYWAYLWSIPSSTEHTSRLSLYRAGTIDRSSSVFDGYEEPWTYDGRGQPVQIQRVGLTRVTPVGPEAWEPPENETAEPADEYEIGEAAATGNLSSELVVATWHTAAKDANNSSVGMGRWIDAAWSGTGSVNEWQTLWKSELIGPCMSASKPVAYRAKVYVACSVDKGYNHTTRAQVGDIHVWTIDPDDGTTRLVGDTGIRGLNPLLTVTADGYFVVVAYDHTPPHDVSVQTAYGWYARHWSTGRLIGALDIGPSMHRFAGYRPLLDAHVTNVIVTEREKTIFLLYGEWNEPKEADPQDLDVGSTAAADKDLQKVLFAFNECQTIGALRMNHTAGTLRIGGDTSVASVARNTYPPGAFNDAHDGFAYTRDPSTDEELVYFALNDHGVAQFGAIVVGATGLPCFVKPPPPIPPAVPVPAAISTGTGAMVATGSTVGVVASLMIGYLLTVKRRTAQYTSVEDR